MVAVAPQLLRIASGDAPHPQHGRTLRVEGRVPKDLALFEGHFPGEPVLPGFAQLHWVAELAREHLDMAPAWSAIEALKFREPLLPDDRFALRIDAPGSDVLRFAFERDERRVSEGRLLCAAGAAADAPFTPQELELPAAPDARDLPLRIPQQGAMRLVTRVLAHADGVTLCAARIPDAHPLVASGCAPVWLALELLAQAMAAQGGLVLGSAARRAFVVGARRVTLHCRELRAGETLWLRAAHVRGEQGLVVCDCALGYGAPPRTAQLSEPAQPRCLARARLTAWVEPDGTAGSASATSSAQRERSP